MGRLFMAMAKVQNILLGLKSGKVEIAGKHYLPFLAEELFENTKLWYKSSSVQ